jgi:nucleoside-diphosphate-sugar epimerase
MHERALVTGAAGFIGSHLCHGLVAEGCDVVALDDLSEGMLEHLHDVPEIRFEHADIRDGEAVAEAARGCRVIYHQAAKRSVLRSMEQPALTTEVNVGGTLNVLLAARDVGATVVAASSSSVYGDQETFPLYEDLDPRPRSPYAVSKLAGEQYGAALHLAYGIPSLWLRYFNVYGPGQDPASDYAAVIPRFVMACLDGVRPVIYGDGEQSRDFTYIDDVIEANMRAGRAQERAFGRAFNIGCGGVPTSVNRLLELIGSMCRVTPRPLFEPPRPGDVRMTQADVSRAGELFGYEPSVDIEEGLKRTVASFDR